VEYGNINPTRGWKRQIRAIQRVVNVNHDFFTENPARTSSRFTDIVGLPLVAREYAEFLCQESKFN
jgi:hypothetical protein